MEYLPLENIFLLSSSSLSLGVFALQRAQELVQWLSDSSSARKTSFHFIVAPLIFSSQDRLLPCCDERLREAARLLPRWCISYIVGLDGHVDCTNVGRVSAHQRHHRYLVRSIHGRLSISQQLRQVSGSFECWTRVGRLAGKVASGTAASHQFLASAHAEELPHQRALAFGLVRLHPTQSTPSTITTVHYRSNHSPTLGV